MKHFIRVAFVCGLVLLCCFQSIAQPVVSRVEYFIDTDPGYGSGTAVPLGTTTSNDLSNLSFSLNIVTLNNGVHIVGVRTRDVNGVWSHDNKWLFAKIPAESTTVPGINKVEYYVNTDPGFGNGTPVTTTGSSTDVSGSVTLDITNFPLGVSIVGVRTRDANGAWSHDNKWLFAKVPAENAAPNIARVEYYLDADPGYGNGTPVAITNASNLPGMVINANITGLAIGKHKIFYRTKDVKGAWSHDNVDSFTLSPYNAAPAIVVNSVTKTTLCARDSFSVGYHATGTYNSSTIFNVELSAPDGSFPVTPVVIGSTTGSGPGGIIKCYLPTHLTDGSAYKIRVNSTGPAITGVSSIYTLTIHDRPYAQTITGDANVNAGYSYPYSVPTVAASTWLWIVPAATITQTTNSASLLWNTVGQPQPIKVVETSQYGCVGDTSSKLVNVYPLKITDVTPSRLTPCPDEALTVAANAYGVYYSGNIFTAQLSNGTGSFASPVAIGTLTPSPQPLGNAQPITINVKLPFPLANGTNYRIRIVSSNYAKTSDTSAAIIVNKPNLGADQNVVKCVGYPVNLTTIFTTTGLDTSWNVVRADSVVTPGTYRLIVTNQYGCKDTAMVTVSDYPQPVPNYTINNTGQCASGNSFVFTNTSSISSGSLTYQWSFGDNITSTATGPTHSYSAPGTFTIRLITTSNNGCIDSIKKTVTVYPQPVAAFTINAAGQCLNGNNYLFNNTSVISSGTITGYQWTFGDNSSSTDESPSHVFLSAGTYNVKVVSTSNNGCKDSITHQVMVYPKPTPAFTVNNASQCASSNSFVFTNTSVISSGTLTYVWLFGDNSTSTATSPTHGYVATGTYTVKLVVTSNNGCKDSVSQTVTVYPQPVAGFTINNSSQCVNGNSFDFTNTTTISSGSVTYQWTFGDNTSSTLASPTHVYTGAGSYTVKLVVTSNNGCKDSTSKTVTVNPKPNLGADTTITLSCQGGTTDITGVYNMSGYSMVSYSTATPTAAAAGMYNVYVTNSSGCKDTAVITVLPAVIETVPSMPNKMMMANRECTDAEGWTHYYNDNGTPNNFSDDIRVLSLKKNGQNIGTVGDGTFNITVAATAGAGGGHAVKVNSPLVEGGVDYYAMNRYWNIVPTTQPGTTVGVRFYFNTTDITDINGDFPGNGLTPPMLTLYKLAGGNPDPTSGWAGATGVQYYNNGSSPSLSEWVYSNLGNNLLQAEFLVNSFSGGGAGGKAFQTLPITLVQFNATAKPTGVQLTWRTSSEINTKAFVVQRSLDGRNFEAIGQVSAAGNSTLPRSYVFNDVQALQLSGGKVYYRLLQTDLNDQQRLSDIRSVTIGKPTNLLTLQYNPVNNEAVLNYLSVAIGKVQLRLTDQAGRVIMVRQESVAIGTNQIRVNTTALVHGIYEVQVITTSDSQHVRMVKQ